MVWTKGEIKMISKFFEPLQKFTLHDYLTIEQLKAIEVYPAAAANLENKVVNLPKVNTRNEKKQLICLIGSYVSSLYSSNMSFGYG